LAAFVFGWFLPSAGRLLVNDEQPVKAEVAVVLAGDPFGNRILRGAELQRAGFVEKVLVSGAPGLYGFFESDLAVRFVTSKGFPEPAFEALHFDHHSTQEEAHNIALELKRRGIKSALVVTSDYHTMRAGRIWRYTASPWLEIHMVSSRDRYFHRERWWSDRESGKHVFSEWVKFIAFTFDFFPPAQSGPVLP
jgi:hypothetical protein